jgi:hypothetical protein
MKLNEQRMMRLAGIMSEHRNFTARYTDKDALERGVDSWLKEIGATKNNADWHSRIRLRRMSKGNIINTTIRLEKRGTYVGKSDMNHDVAVFITVSFDGITYNASAKIALYRK